LDAKEKNRLRKKANVAIGEDALFEKLSLPGQEMPVVEKTVLNDVDGKKRA